MDPATFQLAVLIANLASQLLPLIFSIDTSQFTPEQKVEWDGLIARIKAAQEMVTPYVKEPENQSAR